MFPFDNRTIIQFMKEYSINRVKQQILQSTFFQSDHIPVCVILPSAVSAVRGLLSSECNSLKKNIF